MLLSYRTMSSTTWISSYIRRPSTNIIMNIGKNNRIQQQLFKTISTIDKRRTISSTNTMILPNKWNTYNNNEASYLVYRNNNNINEHHLLLNRYHTTSRSFSDQTTTDVSKKSTTTTTPYNTNVNNDTTLTKTATSTIVNNTDELLSNNILITIYQYQICPFCNRVKALLDYINIPYRIIEVNPLTKYELKQYKKQKYQKVPILTITSSSNNDDDKHIDNNSNNDEEIAIFGSDEIITTLLQRNDIMSKLQHRWKQQQDQHQQLHIMSMNEFWNPSLMTSLLNTNNKDSTTNTTSTTTNIDWNHYAMETLAPILYPNLCRTISDSYNAFGYVNHVTSFTTIQKISIRLLGSLVRMYMCICAARGNATFCFSFYFCILFDFFYLINLLSHVPLLSFLPLHTLSCYD